MSDKWQVNCALDRELVEKLDAILEEDRRFYNRTHLIGQMLWDAVDAYEEANGEIELDD
jgi:metal-responsive CopG/Arc/MetJ family transcriptional regulator